MIKEFLKDTIKYLPAQIVPGLVGLLSIPIITRLFNSNDYGNYSLVMATIMVLVTLQGWLPMSIIRFFPSYEQNKNLDSFYTNIISLTFISLLALTLLYLIFLYSIKIHLSSNLFSLMYVGLGVLVVNVIFEMLQVFIRVKRQIHWFSGFAIWKSIGSLAIALLLIIFYQRGIDSLLWGAILCGIIVLPLVWNKAFKGQSVFHFTIDLSSIKEMGRYSFPLVVANLVAWILSLSDRYILQFFRDTQEVGIYSASYTIADRSIMLFSTLFMLASGPISMHIWEKEGENKSKEFVAKVTRYYLLVCIPAVVGLSFLSKPIIHFLTSREYYEGYIIIPFITAGTFFLGLQQRYQRGLLYHKKTNLIMISMLCAGLLNLVGNFILVPHYGYLAAALTTFISYVFLLILMIIFSRRYFVWGFPFKTLGKVTCASAIMGIVVSYICNRLTYSIQFNLILVICIGIVIYFILLFLFREFQQREQEIMKQVLKKYFLKL